MDTKDENLVDSRSDSPGARLRQLREQKGMTTAEVAENLRLSKQQVEALENDDYTYAPALAYARGHLRMYAKLVGIPPFEILKAFDALNIAEKSPITSIEPLLQHDKIFARGGSPRIMRWWTYALVIVIIVLMVLWWHHSREKVPTIKIPSSEVPTNPNSDVRPMGNPAGTIPLMIPPSSSNTIDQSPGEKLD